MGKLTLYHASDHVISRPCPAEHRRHSDPSRDGNRALGLFCNTEPRGLHVYGDRLYRFKIGRLARILEVPDDLRQTGFCVAYYRGIRDLCDHLGYDGIKVTHEDSIISVVIMNFEVIRDWTFVGAAQ